MSRFSPRRSEPHAEEVGATASRRQRLDPGLPGELGFEAVDLPPAPHRHHGVQVARHHHAGGDADVEAPLPARGHPAPPRGSPPSGRRIRTAPPGRDRGRGSCAAPAGPPSRRRRRRPSGCGPRNGRGRARSRPRSRRGTRAPSPGGAPGRGRARSRPPAASRGRSPRLRCARGGRRADGTSPRGPSRSRCTSAGEGRGRRSRRTPSPVFFRAIDQRSAPSASSKRCSIRRRGMPPGRDPGPSWTTRSAPPISSRDSRRTSAEADSVDSLHGWSRPERWRRTMSPSAAPGG